MADNPQERYERIALDLTKIVIEQNNVAGNASTKEEILQAYIDSYNVVMRQEMPKENK